MEKKYLPFYVVKANDTLGSIAEMYDVSPTQILVENYLTPTGIKEGVVLSITKK